MTTYTLILFKQYLRTPYTYVAFFFPFFFLLIIGQWVPIGIILSTSITLLIVIIILFLFSGIVQELRRVSMIKSVALTKVSKLWMFLSNILVAIVIIFVFTALLMLFAFGLDQTDYFAHDFTSFGDEFVFYLLNYSISWGTIAWGDFLYGIFISIILTFSLAFLVLSLTKTIRTVYLIALIYAFILIVLGGILIPVSFFVYTDSYVQYTYYFLPNYYTNQTIVASLVTENVFFTEIYNNYPVLEEIIGMIDFSSWDWTAIESDANFILNYLAADISNSLLDPEVINHSYDSNLFGFLTTEFELPNQIQVTPLWILVSKFGEEATINLIFLVDLLAQNIDIVFKYFGSLELWNFTSLESLLVFLMPLLITAFSLFVGLFTFNWHT